jgi:hypothetical protein
MTKKGAFFISIVEHAQFTPSVWDPYLYRANGLGKSLGDYVAVTKPRRDQDAVSYPSPFRPIEYRHIPKGKYLTFVLEFCQDNSYPRGTMLGQQLLFDTMRDCYRDNLRSKYPMVGERQLLFGTMRAYLGNVLVTPEAKWLNCRSPLFFPVKSEFVCVAPKDNCTYFWWAYLQSQDLLAGLPLGSGGTRPRLHEEALLQTPVKVPELETRLVTHEKLRECAEREWEEYIRRMQIINSVNL